MIFSVIIPVYNRADPVQTAIDSVTAQTFDDYEIIVVDDGSTDDTPQRLDEIAKRDKRIRVIHKKNGGVSSARNVGIDQANGDYIVFLDSDDRLTPDCLAVLAKHADGCDLICFGLESPYLHFLPCEQEESITVPREQVMRDYLPPFITGEDTGKPFLQHYCWNKCYRNAFLRDKQIRFDETKRSWEDGRFVVDALSAAEAVCLVGKPLYYENSGTDENHLSARWFDNMIEEFISDQNTYRRRFPAMRYGAEWARTNFNSLHNLFNLAVKNRGEAAAPLILAALRESIVGEWIAGIEPRNDFEAQIQELAARKEDKKIFRLYRPNPLTRVRGKIRKILH